MYLILIHFIYRFIYSNYTIANVKFYRYISEVNININIYILTYRYRD